MGHVELAENTCQWNRTTCWDTSLSWVANAGTFINFPIGDAANPGCESSSYCTHPDVCYSPLGWHGWKYIMALTPLGIDTSSGRIDDADENPCLFASNNGEYFVPFIDIDSVTYGAVADYPEIGDTLRPDTWAYQPKGDFDSSRLATVWGDTVVNPITDVSRLTRDTLWRRGKPLHIQHLSDGDIRMFTNDTLYCFFRATYADHRGVGNLAHSIWVTASPNGVIWTDPRRLFTSPLSGQQGTFLMSPTVFVDTGGILTMYIVTDTNTAPWSTARGGPLIVEKRQSCHPMDTIQWQTEVDTCHWTSPWNSAAPPGLASARRFSVWHIDCLKVGDETHCLETMSERGYSGEKATDFFTTSHDGLTFRTPSRPCLTSSARQSNHWDDDRVYRWTGIPVDFGNARGYEVWYAALGTDTCAAGGANRWHIAHSYLHFTPHWRHLAIDRTLGKGPGSSQSTSLCTACLDANDNRPVLWIDSTGGEEASDIIAMYGQADMPLLSDSLVFLYRATGAIDSVEVYVARRGVVPGYFASGRCGTCADSLARSYLCETDLENPTPVALAFNHFFSAGEQIQVRFYTSLREKDSWIKMYRVFLKGTMIGYNR